MEELYFLYSIREDSCSCKTLILVTVSGISVILRFGQSANTFSLIIFIVVNKFTDFFFSCLKQLWYLWIRTIYPYKSTKKPRVGIPNPTQGTLIKLSANHTDRCLLLSYCEGVTSFKAMKFREFLGSVI